MKRYIYRDVPLSIDDARKFRNEQIACELAEIEHRKSQIQECEDHIAKLHAQPLPTSRREQIILNPGDPGYDEAPVPFDPAEYLGELEWVNTPIPQ